MATKAYTSFIQHLHTSTHYDPHPVELHVTSGTGGISIGLRENRKFEGTGAVLTPAEARELAAELNARADEIEARP